MGISSAALRIGVGLLAILVALCPSNSWCKTEYDGVFAPQSGVVAPVEKPFRQEQSLNGFWRFQPQALPAGHREEIDPAPVLKQPAHDGWESVRIRIPSPWNVNSFADKGGAGGDFVTFPSYPKDWEEVRMGWLQRTFDVPREWQGRRIQIRFDAVAGDAEIFVNGKSVGHHFDIFLPFTLDVTDLIHFGGENELRVGVRKASLFDDKRTDKGRRTYQGGSFWGQHIAGIWQDVTLLAVPELRVSDAFVQSDLEKDELAVSLTVRNDGDREVTLSVGGRVSAWVAGSDQQPAIPSLNLSQQELLSFPRTFVTIPAHGKSEMRISAKADGRLQKWSPANPALYGVVVSLSSGDRVVDRHYTRFGWRQITLKGDQVLLNGDPIVLKGDSWHFMGIPQMTRRYAVAWYQALRAANLNAVRLHAQPFPGFYADVADEMGIMVLDETAVWASDGGPKLGDDAFWKDTEAHLAALIRRDRNHPSIFGWSVSNEVHPIVRGVMRNPPGMMDKLADYYGIWGDICRRLDPTRPWISADGEDDGEKHLPVFVVHYGGNGAMERGVASGKPWGVGEAGNAYYGTPEQVASSSGTGDRAYESFLGRMEGVAIQSRDSLRQQGLRHASYRSVFNLVWYGLEPLPFGMGDTSRAPRSSDGVFFTRYREGEPGVQPERLGPYTSTLNPGYDSALPAYKPWPLFEAIRDVSAEPPILGKWFREFPLKQPDSPDLPRPRPVEAIKVLSGDRGLLTSDLARTGVPTIMLENPPEGTVPLLFVDGQTPPPISAKSELNRTLDSGGTVVVWGVRAETLDALNALLPAPVALMDRQSSSLLVNRDASAGTWADPVIAGLTASDLYFSELRPSEVIAHGLSGPLVEQSTVLLQAPDLDWGKWNRQPEYAKTAMILRSERETKPSGIAMVVKHVGHGRLIVTTLPAAPRLAKVEQAVRTILTNLGVSLGEGSANRSVEREGTVVRALVLGSYPAPSLDDGLDRNFIADVDPKDFRTGKSIGPCPWRLQYADSGVFEIDRMGINPRENAVAYLSFWVSSPRSLSDLLIEPDMPVVGLEFRADDAQQIWLNGELVGRTRRTGPLEGGGVKVDALKLRQGWDNILVKVVQVEGRWQFAGRLTSNQPDFLAGLLSSPELP